MDNKIYDEEVQTVSFNELNNKKRKKSIWWTVFLTILLLISIAGATYFALRYFNYKDLNKDIDGDGIVDINIDINKDLKADINIDTNGNNKPNLNIDYKGNRKAIFNIDTDGDGIADSNLVNDATGGKQCSINCDIDGDGWPDINIDLDGDGIADTDIDTNNDGIADLNIDLNGDGLCDVMCDTDNDNECDNNCIKTQYNGKGTGSSTKTGTEKTDAGSAMLLIRYTDGETVNVYNLVPDDQPLQEGETITKPLKTFTIENLSNYSVEYSLKWKVLKNTFTTNNLQYKVESTNGGINLDYQAAPKNEVYIAEKVVIPARSTQKYTISFNLKGTGSNQNIDQAKEFQGLIDIET